MTAMTSNAHETARSIIADMTEDEKLWCLDGDAPFWAGLGYMGRGGYHKAPFYAAEVERLGLPGFAFSDGPRGVGRRPRHLLPGEHGARRDVGPRPRGAHRRRHRPRAPSGRRRPLRRRLRQRAAPPGVGSGAGDLRRGPAPRRRDGRGADPRHPAPRDGVREALRLQLDGERPVHGRHRGRRGRLARGVPPALQADRRRRRRRRDERLQQRQRRVVRREPRAAHRRPARRVGLRGLRDQRLDLRHPRRGSIGCRRARRRDAVPDGAGRWPPRRARSAEDVTWEQIDRSIERVLVHAAALRRRAAAPQARLRRARVPRAPRPRPRSRREVGRPAPQRAGRRRAGAAAQTFGAAEGRSARPARVDREPRRRRVERRLGTRRRHRARRASRQRCLTPRSCHDDGADVEAAAARRQRCGRRPRRGRVTRTPTRASTSATRVSDLRNLMPENGRPGVGRRASRPRPRLGDRSQRPSTSGPRRDEGGFANGGDRTSLRLRDDEVALIHAVAAANPRTVVAIVAGSAVVISEWHRRGPCDRAVLVRGNGRRATRSPTCCSAWSTSPGGFPFTVPDDEEHLPPSTATRATSSTTAGTAGGSSPATATLRHTPSASGSATRHSSLEEASAATSGTAITVHATVRNTGPRTRHRRRAGVLRRAGSPRGLRPRRGRVKRGTRRRDRHPPRAVRGARRRCGTRWSSSLVDTRCGRAVLQRTLASPSRSTSGHLLDGRHHLGREEPQVAL